MGSGGSGTGWPCRATTSSSSPFTTPSSPPTTWKRLQISINRDCNRSDVSMRGSLLISNSGQYAPGFGIGALEELDAEDEDNYASGFAYEQTEVDIEPSKTTTDGNYKLEDRKRGVFLSFKIASNSKYKNLKVTCSYYEVAQNYQMYHQNCQEASCTERTAVLISRGCVFLYVEFLLSS